MRKWSYTTMQFSLQDVMDVDKLNSYGEQGLELVSLERLEEPPAQWIAVFKKLVFDTKEGVIPIVGFKR